ncbi:DUF3142 domain-containing protein [Acinetobacter gerneri]|uniref:DUF3142 domain-containing protein n=1 Tax=Acinetobacter gerneri TaxID=202952 RepID=UPI003A88EC5A
MIGLKHLYKFRIFGLIFLAACNPSQSVLSSEKIDANHFDRFWIWGNISTAPYLKKAKELYILQGDVKYDKKIKQNKVTAQGVGILRIPEQKVWLVFRNHQLTWQNTELEVILNRVRQWESQGNQIVGIQIDFDSKTQNLYQYALFLKEIREKLPKKYQLSITGLMDWANIKDQKTINLLRQNIDEIIIQTYQGTRTLDQYQNYLQRFAKLKLPYKVGLVQNSEWQPLNLAQDPHFKGYVVFLLRSK